LFTGVDNGEVQKVPDKTVEEQYEFAKRLTGMLHHDQGYGVNQYTYHLQQVDMVLNRFGFEKDFVLRTCVWLHDLIEDQHILHNKICHAFGEKIADVVYDVTNEMGRNRKEKFLKTYPKIKANRDALIVKLADRIANIKFSKGTSSSHAEMYKKEWPEFREALYVRGKDVRV